MYLFFSYVSSKYVYVCYPTAYTFNSSFILIKILRDVIFKHNNAALISERNFKMPSYARQKIIHFHVFEIIMLVPQVPKLWYVSKRPSQLVKIQLTKFVILKKKLVLNLYPLGSYKNKANNLKFTPSWRFIKF